MVTAEATVFAVGPAPAIAAVIVTAIWAGSRVEPGKPDPVTFRVVSPACPTAGVDVATSVTVVCAESDAPRNPKTIRNRDKAKTSEIAKPGLHQALVIE